MDNWTVVTVCDRGRHLGRRFFGLFRHLPLAQRGPALIICAAQDGGVANGYAVFLRFIDNAVLQRHGLRRGFIDAGIVEAAFVKDGHRKDMRGNDAGGILSDFNHSGSAQLVRFTTLGERAGNGRRTYQHEHRAGQEPASAI